MSARQLQTALDQMRIELRGIGQAIGTSWLTVPPYQRDYAWDVEQVEELLADLAEAIRNRDPEYFLGSIVTTVGESGSLHVTDGQQRLATISIILAAIRNYFLEKGETERASELENEFLSSRDRRTRELHPHLRMNAHDHAYYEQRVLKRSEKKCSSKPDSSSHKRLDKAVVAVTKYIGTVAKANPRDPINALLDWVEYIEQKCKVIWVIVPDDSNAFTIFETLNDRGLDLAISDLLKNFLFHKAGSRLSEAQAYWATMTGILEATSEDEILVTYLRHYWSSVEGLTRERDLYKRVKRGVSTVSDAVDLTKKLSDNATQYAALSNTSHELWKKYGPTTQGHIATLNVLRMTQMRPLLLSILDGFSVVEAKKAMRFLVDFAVRILIVGARGGSVETSYCETAKKIRNGFVKSASSLRADLKGVFPADAEFRDGFSVATVSRTYLARYYLGALERAVRKESQPEFVPNSNADDINLEHVIPLRPDRNWKHLSTDDCKSIYRRLGNMALLKSNENAKSGNAPFSEKKEVLGQSTYRLTKMIADQTLWGDKQVSDRQRALAELAVKTWSGKFSR